LRQTSAIIPFIALVMLIAGCVSTEYEMCVSPDKKQAGAAYEYEDCTVRYTSPDLSVEATHLPPNGLALYYSAFKDGAYKNPFSPKGFLVFSLRLENKGKKTLTYDPKSTFIMTSGPNPLHVMDISSIYMDFEIARLEDARERMDAVKAACFDTMQVIEPGQRMQGLIVFQRRDDVGNGASLVLDGLYTGGEAQKVIMVFKRGLAVKDDE